MKTLLSLVPFAAVVAAGCQPSSPAAAPTEPHANGASRPASSSSSSGGHGLAARGTCGQAADPGKSGDGDSVIGPSYKEASELTPGGNTPRGTIVTTEMPSSMSKIFPGINGPWTRGITVYVPRQYVDGTPAPLMVVQDGGDYVGILTPVLDTMIADKRLPPIVAVFVDNGGGDARGSERGLEYDRVSPDYGTFIETEVLPMIPKLADIQTQWKNLRFTRDPEGRATMGTSSGGAAAFTMAWFRPDRWRRVLTYSGTFVNQHPEPAHPAGAWEYHSKLIKESPAKPIRVYLEAGDSDFDWDAEFKDGQHNWANANKAMAKVLAQKGYHYKFQFAKGAGHVDQNVMRQTLPDALAWLWRGYVPCGE